MGVCDSYYAVNSRPFAAYRIYVGVVKFPNDFENTYKNLLEKKIVAGLPIEKYYPELKGCYLLCATETSTREDLDNLVKEVTS